jgi:hypothetical protein
LACLLLLLLQAMFLWDRFGTNGVEKISPDGTSEAQWVKGVSEFVARGESLTQHPDRELCRGQCVGDGGSVVIGCEGQWVKGMSGEGYEFVARGE